MAYLTHDANSDTTVRLFVIGSSTALGTGLKIGESYFEIISNHFPRFINVNLSRKNSLTSDLKFVNYASEASNQTIFILHFRADELIDWQARSSQNFLYRKMIHINSENRSFKKFVLSSFIVHFLNLVIELLLLQQGILKPGVSSDEQIENYREFILEATSSRIFIILESKIVKFTPVIPTILRFLRAKRMKRLFKTIEHVHFIDYRESGIRKEHFLKDKFHLSKQGHSILAWALIKQIEKFF